MSLIHVTPASLHALGDYLAGVVLLVVGGFCLGPDRARGTGIILGLALMSVSLLTRYPLGVLPIVRFPVHSAADYLIGLSAILAPFVLAYPADNPGVSATYAIVGVVVIAVSLATDYSSMSSRHRQAEHGRSPVPAGHR